MAYSSSSSKSRTPITNKLKRTLHSLANSSDTENYETPPRKRFRRDDSVSVTSSASSSRGSVGRRSSIRCASRSEPKRVTRFDLPSVLWRCAKDSNDYAAMDELKGNLPKDRTSLYLIQHVLDGAKISTKRRADVSGKALLQTELYLDWLKGINHAVSAVENMLNAKIQGTRKRVGGLGRPAFAILYTLIDEFVSEVAIHHDGGSFCSPLSASAYPLTMTLVEEARDPSADARSEAVLKEVEELLRKYDDIMFEALKRYKSESAKSKRVARAIGKREQSLTRALCWLCENTGFGGEECDTGDSLLHNSRRAMQYWKEQYAANDDDNGASDDDW